MFSLWYIIFILMLLSFGCPPGSWCCFCCVSSFQESFSVRFMPIQEGELLRWEEPFSWPVSTSFPLFKLHCHLRGAALCPCSTLNTNTMKCLNNVCSLRGKWLKLYPNLNIFHFFGIGCDKCWCNASVSLRPSSKVTYEEFGGERTVAYFMCWRRQDIVLAQKVSGN